MKSVKFNNLDSPADLGYEMIGCYDNIVDILAKLDKLLQPCGIELVMTKGRDGSVWVKVSERETLELIMSK